MYFLHVLLNVCFAILMSLCIDVMVMSSAQVVVRFTGACGIEVSVVYMLNNVGVRTLPCGPPVFNWRCVDVLFVNVLYLLRPLM